MLQQEYKLKTKMKKHEATLPLRLGKALLFKVRK